MADFSQHNLQRFSEMDIFNIPHFSLPTPLSHHNNNNLFNNTLITLPVHEVREQQSTPTPSISPNISYCSASTAEFEADTSKRRKNRLVRGKKGRVNETEEGKTSEVVHVRAKRGQATDSHSIAERVRREKINKKMRCLQDLVPGCQKTMGMAGMLEEIINYVHSLQNQVEFLSMELAAACSSSQDFNLQSDPIRKGTNPHEAMEMEKWAYGGGFHSTSWSL